MGGVLGYFSNSKLANNQDQTVFPKENLDLNSTDLPAVEDIPPVLLGTYGALHLHSGVKVISWLGVSGGQAWAIGGLSTAVGKFIVEPLFNILMPDVLEYPS